MPHLLAGVAEPSPTTREQPKPEEDMKVPQPNTSASSDNAAVLQWLQEQTQKGSPDKRQDHTSSESTLAATEVLQHDSSKQLTQPPQRLQVTPPHQLSVEKSQEVDAASEASLEDDMIAAAVTESLLENARVCKDVVPERTESGVDDSAETSDHGVHASPKTDVLDTEVCDKTPPVDSREVSDGEEENVCYSSDSNPPSEAEESAQQAEEVTEHEPVQERPDVASTSQERVSRCYFIYRCYVGEEECENRPVWLFRGYGNVCRYRHSTLNFVIRCGCFASMLDKTKCAGFILCNSLRRAKNVVDGSAVGVRF